MTENNTISADIIDNPNYVLSIDDNNIIQRASKNFCKDICSVNDSHNCPASASNTCCVDCSVHQVNFAELFIARDRRRYLENRKSQDHTKSAYELNMRKGALIKITELNLGDETLITANTLPDMAYTADPRKSLSD